VLGISNGSIEVEKKRKRDEEVAYVASLQKA